MDSATERSTALQALRNLLAMLTASGEMGLEACRTVCEEKSNSSIT